MIRGPRLLGPVVGLLIAAGCAASSAPAPRPEAEITFIDSATFDRALSGALGEGVGRVTIRLAAPATLNDVPERLDRWIYAVNQQHGNELRVEPDPEQVNARSIVGAALAITTRVYDLLRETMLYGPARDYDVLVHYRHPDGELTRVIFQRRVNSAESP